MPSCPIIDVRQIPTHVHISHLKRVSESCDVDCFTYENIYKSKKIHLLGTLIVLGSKEILVHVFHLLEIWVNWFSVTSTGKISIAIKLVGHVPNY